MTYPDSISVYHRLSTAPSASTSSFILDVLILSERHRRPAARCIEDVVLYDYKAAKTINLGERPWLLRQFEETWQMQERRKMEVRRRAEWVEEGVRVVEMGTWDKDGAVEDMGGKP